MRNRLLLGMAMVLSLSLSAMGSSVTGSADSIIIGNATIAPGQNQVTVPVYFVTHGDITYYNLPLRIESDGEIKFLGRMVGQALEEWDDNWENTNSGGNEISQFGFADLGGEDNPGLNTNGSRVDAFSITLTLDENAEFKGAVITARVDERTGGPLYGYNDGLTGSAPIVVGGILAKGDVEPVQTTALPIAVSLSQNYPNPFNPTTDISFALPDARNVKLTVFNVLGQEVRDLVDEVREAGYHKVTWDGLNNSGRQVPSGAYFYRIEAGDFVQSMKMVLLK